MSGDDEGFDQVFEQVEAALDALNLGKGPTREALMSGVHDALSALVHVELESVQVPADEGGPGVVVLDGGKGDDTDEVPLDEAKRPTFQIFDNKDASDSLPELERRGIVVGHRSHGRQVC